MTKQQKTVYFSEHLKKDYPSLFQCLEGILARHGYPVKTLKQTRDIWIRDFMPIMYSNRAIQYRYTPDYLKSASKAPYRTDPTDPVAEIGLDTEVTALLMDGGNLIQCGDRVLMTDKILDTHTEAEIAEVFSDSRLLIVPRDPDPEEVYGHIDGMVRCISEGHLLVNSQYEESFKENLHATLREAGFQTSELAVKEDTKYAWGYINFLHIGDLIIQPSIDKVNDAHVKSQLEKLYPGTTVELCDAKKLVRKGGVFNCVSWEH